MRDWITLSAALVLIAGAFILGMRCRGGESQTVVLRVHDTLKIKEIVRDTVLRWYERIVWKEAEPETVVVYADTIRPDTIWGRCPEAIISLDYSSGKLSFTSLLPVPDSEGARGIIKDYSYKVGERFAIRTKGEGFHVRTKRSGPRFEVGVGSGVRLAGDTLQARVVPFIFASLVYRGLSLGPRLDTKGLHLCLSYRWSF
ncbi:hypothetical protein ES703_26408 [subsurface metagenome]